MTGKLVWDKIGERLYETGTSKGVLYVQDTKGVYKEGVAWNGLVSVKQSPDGAEPNDQYADNIKYLSLTSAENFKGSVDAFTYPEEFAACDGSAALIPGVTLGQQDRAQFGLSYATIVGNDTMRNNFGEKIHIIYGAQVAPSERSYETVNEDPSVLTLSWEFTTTPAVAEGFKPTAYICVDSTKVAPEVFKKVQDTLYGSESEAPKLPALNELLDMIKSVTTTTTTSTTTTTTTSTTTTTTTKSN